MAGGGRISLLIDSPLPALIQALKGVDAEANKQIQTHTRANGLPIWQDELASRVTTRLEAHLAGSGAIGVQKGNIFLKAAQKGKLSSGTPIKRVALAAEFGRAPSAPIKRVSRRGVRYEMRTGGRFRPRNRRGYIVYPAFRAAVPRIGALWIQTYIRTMHEQVEGVDHG